MFGETTDVLNFPTSFIRSNMAKPYLFLGYFSYAEESSQRWKLPYTGWWFGTFFFHILGIIIPTDEAIFFRGVG
jgi:hypothetical protein